MTMYSTAPRRSAILLVSLPLLLLLPQSGRCFDGFDPNGTGPLYPASANGRNGDMPSLGAARTVNGGIEIRINFPSLDGVRPRLAFRIAFST